MLMVYEICSSVDLHDKKAEYKIIGNFISQTDEHSNIDTVSLVF